MNKKIFFFLLIINSTFLFPQKEISIKVTPFKILHPLTAMVPIAVEFRANKFGIEFEQGVKINSFMLDWRYNKTDFKYYSSQLGLRYYLSFNDVTQFVGFSAYYLPLNYTETNGTYVNLDKENIKFQSSNVFIEKICVRLNYGLVFPINSSFRFELLSGLGLKQKTTKHQSIINPDEDKHKHEWLSNLYGIDGKTISPSLQLSFRLTYDLKL